MTTYVLEGIDELRRHLSEGFEVYQVTETEGAGYHWQKCSADSRRPLLSKRPASSPKRFFFAERETLFSFDGKAFRPQLPQPHPFALLGVQACDLVAIAYLDRFFAEDAHYQARRREALLVGLDCGEPCEGGFCDLMDAGPGVRSETADLTLHRLSGESYLLFVHTEMGRQALEGMPLEPAPEGAIRQRNADLEACEAAFGDHTELSRGIEALRAGDVAEELWAKMGVQCVACSGCTNLCPTCSCYGTRPVPHDGGASERYWDSCLLEAFQREASFHNPSEAAGARVRRFWTHKFGDAFSKELGRDGCVGCGRCEAACIGVIGVHSVMKRIDSHA